MVELERAIVRWQAEGTPELRGAVVWRAAQVLWETAALFRRHAGAAPLGLLCMHGNIFLRNCGMTCPCLMLSVACCFLWYGLCPSLV